MIVLYNPLSTTPGKQPLPLSVMALAAVLEGREDWSLVDGNVVADPAAEIISRLAAVPRSVIALLAVTVMPGPQLTQAVAVCRRVRKPCRTCRSSGAAIFRRSTRRPCCARRTSTSSSARRASRRCCSWSTSCDPAVC